MNRLFFSALEIILESEDRVINEGPVEDCIKHLRKAHKKGVSIGYREGDKMCIPASSMEKLIRSMFVRYVGNRNDGKKVRTYCMFYLKERDKYSELRNRGSIESGLLCVMGRLDLLQEKIDKRYLSIDLKKLIEEENSSIPNQIGGIYAMDIAGADVLNIPLDDISKNERKTYAIYQKALRERPNFFHRIVNNLKVCLKKYQ
mgnify:CR=1 FL=1